MQECRAALRLLLRNATSVVARSFVAACSAFARLVAASYHSASLVAAGTEATLRRLSPPAVARLSFGLAPPSLGIFHCHGYGLRCFLGHNVP